MNSPEFSLYGLSGPVCSHVFTGRQSGADWRRWGVTLGSRPPGRDTTTRSHSQEMGSGGQEGDWRGETLHLIWEGLPQCRPCYDDSLLLDNIPTFNWRVTRSAESYCRCCGADQFPERCAMWVGGWWRGIILYAGYTTEYNPAEHTCHHWELLSTHLDGGDLIRQWEGGDGDGGW